MKKWVYSVVLLGMVCGVAVGSPSPLSSTSISRIRCLSQSSAPLSKIENQALHDLLVCGLRSREDRAVFFGDRCGESASGNNKGRLALCDVNLLISSLTKRMEVCYRKNDWDGVMSYFILALRISLLCVHPDFTPPPSVKDLFGRDGFRQSEPGDWLNGIFATNIFVDNVLKTLPESSIPPENLRKARLLLANLSQLQKRFSRQISINSELLSSPKLISAVESHNADVRNDLLKIQTTLNTGNR